MNKKLPYHIAIIPDGNRRWAKSRGLILWKGHQEGVKRFREISEVAFRAGIPYLTFWGASEDNLLKRSKVEVRLLVSLLRKSLEQELKEKIFIKNKIHINVVGRWSAILKDSALERAVNALEEETKHFTRHRLTILFGYDGRREMIEAISKIANSKESRKSPNERREDFRGSRSSATQGRALTGSPQFRDHGIHETVSTHSSRTVSGQKSKINYETVKKALWTGHLPPVDLVIRTGGEPHWSAGFMMWLTSDSQFYFTKTLWPDFDAKEFKKALREYGARERRFGR